MGEQNYDTIIGDIVQFFGNLETFPPFFTNINQMEMVQSVIAQLCQDDIYFSNFKIYPLHQLFFTLKREAISYGLDEDKGFASIHIAQAMIDRDQYDYNKDIACNVSGHFFFIGISKYYLLNYFFYF